VTLQQRYEKLTAASTQSWLSANELTAPQTILLNPPRDLADIKGDIVDQLSARKKARKKLPSWYDQANILWPPPLSIEQASSEATAKYKSSLISGKRLTDLTGGTGIDLLAMSECFDSVTYVEQDEWLCRVFEHNATLLGKENISVSNARAEDMMGSIEAGQWVFLDPARRNQEQKKVFMLEDCSPNLLEVLPLLKQKEARVMVKLSPILDLQHVISELQPYRLIVLSVQNEVKELLALVGEGVENEVQIETIDLRDGDDHRFDFTLSSEKTSQIAYGPTLSYLYEPNVAIMKAGAFKSVASTYNLRKLHANTHLYTSDDLQMGFPGRIFRIIQEIAGVELKSKYKNCDLHVITRNYPQNASQITKKYQFKESGDRYLIAYSNYKGKKCMLMTELIKTDRT
jgi:hypothetical protein